MRVERLAAVLCLGACSSAPGGSQVAPPPADVTPAGPQPPVAEKRSHIVASPNGDRRDPYFWLRDDNRKDPAVLAHLEAENGYTKEVLAAGAAERETLYQEMIARLEQDESTVPELIDGWYYYKRYAKGAEHPIYARKRTLEGAEQIILDVNQAAAGHSFYKTSTPTVSRDGKKMAYVEDTVGRRKYRLRIVDLETGKALPDTAENIQSGLVWAGDSRTLFYVERHPETLLGYRVRRHLIGAAGDDPIVYEEPDTSFYLSIEPTKSGQYVIVHSESTETSEARRIDARRPASPPVVVLPRERGHEYQVDHLDGRWVIRTNWKATNFRIVETPSPNDRERWKDVVAHSDEGFIHSFDLHRDFIAVSERSGGLRRVRVVPRRGEPFVIDSEESASTMSVEHLPRRDSPVVRYSYTSMTTPKVIYDLDVASRTKTERKREVVAGYDRSQYASEWLWATARDGTKIPVSLVYRKGTALDGTAPLMQYGYGAYGSSRDPKFRSEIVSLLDRGFVYANAHVRGGQEMGRRWYEGGRLLAKRNSFTDFIDVTRFLVGKKYGAADKVIAVGGSAGGLLVGAVANMAPSEYRAVLAWVPFVDVVTTMLDESIPLTTNEYDEWGDPRKKEYYEYMLSYSPYDNVAATGYPAMLVPTGLHDSQVQYWEPAKWVARLRELDTGGNPILLWTEMSAGHGGKSGRYQKYTEIARDYAWMLQVLRTPDLRRRPQ